MQITFTQTLQFFKDDLTRRLVLEGKKVGFLNCLWLLPKRGIVSVLIYRLKRYFFYKNNIFFKLIVRLLKFPEFHYCHNELDPRADIGPGLVLSDLGGVAVGFTVIIGKNCTFMGKATPTLGAMEGVDLENERIRIGDNCVIGHNVKVINAVSIADYVQIKPNAVLMTSVKQEGAIMAGFPAKTVTVAPVEGLQVWSPLLSKKIAVAN